MDTDSSFGSDFSNAEPFDSKDSLFDSSSDENCSQYLSEEDEVIDLPKKSGRINKPKVPLSTKAKKRDGPSNSQEPKTITFQDEINERASIGSFSKSPGLKLPADSKHTSLDFFKLLFDNKIYHKIVYETNKYAVKEKKICNWVNISTRELAAFFGMILGISTKAPVLRLRDIWDTDLSIRQSYFANIMTRDRFFNILSCLHFNNNESMPDRKNTNFDKIYKIRPIVDYCNQNFKAVYELHREVAVGQATTELASGNNKQDYDPSQSIKQSFTWWIFTDSHNGYVYHMELYTGEDKPTDDNLHQGTQALLSVVLPHLVNQRHVIFCGKSFSSVALAKKLSVHKLYCCSTLSINSKDIPDSITKLYKKPNMKRGEWHSVIDKNNDLQFLIWMDEKPVLMINNAYPPYGSYTLVRRNKNGSQQSYPCPSAVKMYKQYISGVGLANHKRLQYGWNRRTARWPLCLFWHCFNTAVSNAYILYCDTSAKRLKTKTFLEFQRALSHLLINGYSSVKNVPNTHVSPHLKHQSYVNHKHVDLREYNISMYKRCAVCYEKKFKRKTHFGCLECGMVPICNKSERGCFIAYHSINMKSQVNFDNMPALHPIPSCRTSKQMNCPGVNIPSSKYSSSGALTQYTVMNKCRFCDYKDVRKLVLEHHETNHFTHIDTLEFRICFT